MSSRQRSSSRPLAASVISASLVLCFLLALVPSGTAAEMPSTVTILRENFENPRWTCDTPWDQDGKEMWARGDGNSGSGEDTWCFSTFKVATSGDRHSAWCAVVGNNSIYQAKHGTSLANTALMRYDANMSAFMRHSLSPDPQRGDATLTFIYWSKTLASSAPGGFDHFSMSVSADNRTYTTIWTQPTADEGSWRSASVTVPASTRTISFDFISGPNTAGRDPGEGAYVDNILVTQVADPSWSYVKPLPAFSPGTFQVEVAADTGQGVPESVKLYYQQNAGGSFQLYRGDGHQDGSYDYGEPIIFVSPAGERTYLFYSIASGNGVTEPAPTVPDATTSVDSTVPTVEATVEGTMGTGGYYLAPVTVRLTAEDQLSGVQAIQYKEKGGQWVVYEQELLFIDDGDRSIAYRALDYAGNVGPEGTLAILIDRTSPITVYAVDVAGELSLAVKDTASGAAATYYRLDGGEWKNYPFDPSALDGHRIIEYYSVDRAGNNEMVRSLDLGDVPMSRVTLDLQIPGTAYRAGGPIGLNWTASGPSGLIDHCEVLVDGEPFLTMSDRSGSLTLTDLAEGEHTVTLRAVDGGGNSSYRTVALTVGEGATGDGLSGLVVPGLAVVGAAGVVGAILYWRSRRSG